MTTLFQIKCDGCGKRSDPFSKDAGDNKPNYWRSIELVERSPDGFSKVVKIDLCPDCVKRALEWIKNELPEQAKDL